MVEGSYQTRRQKEAQQRFDQEREEEHRRLEQAYTRCLQEMGVVPEEIKLAWRKMRDAITAIPTRSAS